MTAPISVIAVVPAEPPVVSRSTTVNVVVAQRLVEFVQAHLLEPTTRWRRRSWSSRSRPGR